MLETILSSQFAYEQIIATDYQTDILSPRDGIVIQEMFEQPEAKNLQKERKNKFNNKVKSSSFLQILFFNKFKKFPSGESWEMQQASENKDLFEKISWRSPSHDFEYRKDMVTRSHSIKNIQAIEEFRNYLDKTPDEVLGIVGLLNRYSPYRSFLTRHKNILPQTDLCYMGPKETFLIYNNSSQSRTVIELFSEQFGIPSNEEIQFLHQIISLDSVIDAYESYYYNDYASECNLGQTGSQSFLSLFFYRKNAPNQESWNVTPVSYSRLSRKIRTQSKLRTYLFHSIEEFAYKQNITFESDTNNNLQEQVKNMLTRKRIDRGIKTGISINK